MGKSSSDLQNLLKSHPCDTLCMEIIVNDYEILGEFDVASRKNDALQEIVVYGDISHDSTSFGDIKFTLKVDENRTKPSYIDGSEKEIIWNADQISLEAWSNLLLHTNFNECRLTVNIFLRPRIFKQEMLGWNIKTIKTKVGKRGVGEATNCKPNKSTRD